MIGIPAAALAFFLSAAPAAPAAPRCVEIAGISDLHGHVEALPEIAGYAAILRGRGPLLLVDAGDSIQGTLEVSLSQGRATIGGYGALGVSAAAIGNHEFDYGPDVLRARIAEAPYPFLAANVRYRDGRGLDWKNVRPRMLVTLPGRLVVGLMGLSGEDTPYVTMERNVAALEFGDAAAMAVAQARALRAEGARVVVALAHVGGHCREPAEPDDLSSCDLESALFRLAARLPPGAVDVIVAGHTHEVLARRVNGVALVQGGARAEALSWVTACDDGTAEIHPPVRLGSGAPILGKRPEPDREVAAAVAPYLAASRAERDRPVGVRLGAPLLRSRTELSTFGAAAAASLRDAARADLAIVNAGALRIDLPAGDLRFGQLYEALPFEDSLAVMSLTGREVEELFRALSRSGKGQPQAAGVVVTPDGLRTCEGQRLDPSRTYRVATNEFLANGGDGVRRVTSRIPRDRVKLHHDVSDRDALVRWLKKAPPERLAAPCP